MLLSLRTSHSGKHRIPHTTIIAAGSEYRLRVRLRRFFPFCFQGAPLTKLAGWRGSS